MTKQKIIIGIVQLNDEQYSASLQLTSTNPILTIELGKLDYDTSLQKKIIYHHQINKFTIVPNTILFRSALPQNNYLLNDVLFYKATTNYTYNSREEQVTFRFAIKTPSRFFCKHLKQNVYTNKMITDYSKYSLWFGTLQPPTKSLHGNQIVIEPRRITQNFQLTNHRYPRFKIIIEKPSIIQEGDGNSYVLRLSVEFETYSQKPITIQKHLYWQHQLANLIHIATAQIVKPSNISIHRDKDCQHITPKLKIVNNYALICSDISDEPYSYQHLPIFYYWDIGEDGIEKWFNLYREYEYGINVLLRTLDFDSSIPAEEQITMISIAVEAIGTQIEIEISRDDKDDKTEKEIRYIQFYECIDALLNDFFNYYTGTLVNKGLREEWRDNFNKAYNDYKHFGRRFRNSNTHITDIRDAYQYALEAQLLIRLWIATRIGCSNTRIEEVIAHFKSTHKIHTTKSFVSLFKI